MIVDIRTNGIRYTKASPLVMGKPAMATERNELAYFFPMYLLDIFPDGLMNRSYALRSATSVGESGGAVGQG